MLGWGNKAKVIEIKLWAQHVVFILVIFTRNRTRNHIANRFSIKMLMYIKIKWAAMRENRSSDFSMVLTQTGLCSYRRGVEA